MLTRIKAIHNNKVYHDLLRSWVEGVNTYQDIIDCGFRHSVDIGWWYWGIQS